MDELKGLRGRGLRILLSAYACGPGRGSEPGVGWAWARHLAEAGHEVWVITRANNSGLINRTVATEPVPNLHFAYTDLPKWARFWKRGERGARVHHWLWQWWAYRVAKRLHAQVRFDLAHHITFGVFRQPSIMAFLPVPFVFGPVGGGERAPFSLRSGFPLRGHFADLLRDAANLFVHVDPLMRAVYSRSAVILCRTTETASAIPRKYRTKCRVLPELAIQESEEVADPLTRGREYRVICVARLITGKAYTWGSLLSRAWLKRELTPASQWWEADRKKNV